MQGFGENSQTACRDPDNNLQARDRDRCKNGVAGHIALLCPHRVRAEFGADRDGSIGMTVNYRAKSPVSLPSTTGRSLLGPPASACALCYDSLSTKILEDPLRNFAIGLACVLLAGAAMGQANSEPVLKPRVIPLFRTCPALLPTQRSLRMHR